MGLEDANFDVSSYNLGYPNDMWEGGVYVKFTYTQQTVTQLYMEVTIHTLQLLTLLQ